MSFPLIISTGVTFFPKKKSTFPTTLFQPFHIWPVSFCWSSLFLGGRSETFRVHTGPRILAALPFRDPRGMDLIIREMRQLREPMSWVPMKPLMTSIPSYKGHLWIRKIIIQQKTCQSWGVCKLGFLRRFTVSCVMVSCLEKARQLASRSNPFKLYKRNAAWWTKVSEWSSVNY